MRTELHSLGQVPLTLARQLDRLVTAGSLSNARSAERDNEMRRALVDAARGPTDTPTEPVRTA